MSAEIGLDYAFEIRATIAAALDGGKGRNGHRRIIPITGGTVSGPKLNGRVVPGGADYELVRRDGSSAVEAHYALEADDGTPIYMMNRGYRHAPPDVAARQEALEPVEPTEYYMRIAPTFETPIGKHDWLTRTIIVGSAERRSDHSIFDYYAVL
jgi:hypothetical protein